MKNKKLTFLLYILGTVVITFVLTYITTTYSIDIRLIYQLSTLFAIVFAVTQMIYHHIFDEIKNYIFLRKRNSPSPLFLIRLLAAIIIISTMLVLRPNNYDNKIENVSHITFFILLNLLLVLTWTKSVAVKIQDTSNNTLKNQLRNKEIAIEDNQSKFIDDIQTINKTPLTTNEKEELLTIHKPHVLEESVEDLKKMIYGERANNKIKWIKCGKNKSPSYVEVYNLLLAINNITISNPKVLQISHTNLAHYIVENFTFIKDGQEVNVKTENMSKSFGKYISRGKGRNH